MRGFWLGAVRGLRTTSARILRYYGKLKISGPVARQNPHPAIALWLTRDERERKSWDGRSSERVRSADYQRVG
jgi:hypothetical protein